MPAPYDSVSVAFLRQSFDIVMSHVVELRGEQLSVDADYFWAVPPGGEFDMSNMPKEFTVGSVAHSLERLENFAEHPDETLAVGLAGLLRGHIPRDSRVIGHWVD